MSDSNPAPSEDTNLAAMRRMREKLAQIRPQGRSEERQKLLKKFRRERLKQQLKQFAAAVAFLVPLCFVWTWTGAAHRLRADLPRLLGFIPGLIELATLLLLFAFHGLILWMICRKVRDGRRWEVGWNVILLCILILAGTYLMAMYGHWPPEPE